ncbi:MAG: hypothetical protein K0B09_13695, partial [Bacteroidales bacterium]|nr:hypothetical protein [Bacteroidales bacterium]
SYQVQVYDFHEVVNRPVMIKDKLVFYAFSQKENYRQYIRDVIYHLSKHNKIIPSYDLLKCHENKGYQELYKREIGLQSLNAGYYTSYREVDVDRLVFPVVLKTIKGTNGNGVFLLKNKADFFKVVKKLRNQFDLLTRLDLLRRKYFRKKKFSEYPDFSDRRDYDEYREYLRVEEDFVLQQFVPNLNFDYRVLVACGRYYVMKRSVKNGDFRASGSKLFSFSKVPDQGLLNYARSVYEKFDTPFLSLDVMFDGKNYFLGEFQALHFGMSAMAKSEGFFGLLGGSEWTFVEEKPNLEKIFGQTLVFYLGRSCQEKQLQPSLLQPEVMLQ